MFTGSKSSWFGKKEKKRISVIPNFNNKTTTKVCFVFVFKFDEEQDKRLSCNFMRIFLSAIIES